MRWCLAAAECSSPYLMRKESIKFWFDIIIREQGISLRYVSVVFLSLYFSGSDAICIPAAATKSERIPGHWAVTIMCNFQQKAHTDSTSAHRCIIVIVMSALTFRPFYQTSVDVSAALFITVITFRRTISKTLRSELIDPPLFTHTELRVRAHCFISGSNTIDQIRLFKPPLIHQRACSILYHLSAWAGELIRFILA